MTRLWRSSVRFGFRLLYHEFAFSYDLVSWVASMGAWRCWVESSLRHLPPGSPVLELSSAGESDVYILKMDWKGTAREMAHL